MATKKKPTTAVVEKKDPSDRLPNTPAEGLPSRRVDVTTCVEFWDGWQLRKEGERFIGTFPIDEETDEAILPESKVKGPLVVPTEDYQAPEIDLPGTTLDARRRQGVRGGASGMPNL